jgi:hypothetical protein
VKHTSFKVFNAGKFKDFGNIKVVVGVPTHQRQRVRDVKEPQLKMERGNSRLLIWSV